MIDFKNVTKVYDPKIVALKDVNVHIDKGEFVFVLGHSGAGKSTFLKLMLREEKATKGEVIVNGYNLSKIKERDIPYMRRTLGVVFQDFRLIPNLTAYENIAFAMRVTNIDEKEIKRRVPYILNLVGLAGKRDKLPAQLSGGEQQRVAIARAVAKNPKLLLCDEPTGALDYVTGKQVLKVLQDMSVEHNMTVVMITHNAALADMGQKIIKVRSGKIADIVINENPKKVEDIEY